jgi:cytidylate kinase
MITNDSLPVLITFDGQARSGKGTIVHAVKRSLQDLGIKTMLIDAGQVFRVLVVSASQHGIDIDDTVAIDAFLSDESMLEETAALVKKVYDMDHDQRDALLYTTEVGANSAKFGARPKAQDFKDSLLKKWYKDAGDEGYQVILHDGRALEETGLMLERSGLCRYKIGFYFECNPVVGARRMLGFAGQPYESLVGGDKESVDALVEQIKERNRADSEREVQPIVPPADADSYILPTFDPQQSNDRQMFIVDTSAEMTKEQMVESIVLFFEDIFGEKADR